MLGTVDFRCFCKYRCPAIFDQKVDGGAQCRICGNPGITVGPSALKRQHDLGGRPRFSLGARGNGQHGFDALDSLVDGFFGSTCRLNCHGLKVIAFDHSVFILHAIDLKHLATQANHQGGAEIGMSRVTPLRPPQQLPAFAVCRHAAPAAMNKRDRAVDFRMVVENSGSIDFLGNEFCDRS